MCTSAPPRYLPAVDHNKCLLLGPPCQASVPTLDPEPGHQPFICLPIDLQAAQHEVDGLN